MEPEVAPALPPADLKERIERALEEFDAALAYIDKGLLKVRAKAGGMVVFKPTWLQAKLYRHIRAQIARGKQAKVVILKARQIGFSTAIAMLFLSLTIVREAVVALVVAHEKKAADKIFAIYRRALHNLPEDDQPETDFDSMRHVVFANSESEFGVEIAVKGKLGRSDTVTYAHFSEYAWWEEQPETLQAALSAIPEAVGTIAVIETTANGWGDDFHEKWLEAENTWTTQSTGWEPFFVPWFHHNEYHLKLPDDYTQTMEENALQAEHKLAKTQVHWRRHKIKNECGNDVNLFDREFPTTPTHAFRATGEHVFNQKSLDFIATHNATDPLGIFDIGVTLEGEPYRNYNERGYFRVYKEPMPGREYAICADPTHNLGLNPDDAAFHIFDIVSREQVAAFSGPMGADELGDCLVGAARMYANAYVIVETNIGFATVKRMHDGWGYGNIHYYKTAGEVGAEPTWQMGFQTTPRTRAESIHVTKRLIGEMLLIIRDKPTLAELQQFKEIKKGDKKKAQAPKGKQDNLVMALCILCYVANDRWRWISVENYANAIKSPRPQYLPRVASFSVREAEARYLKLKRRKEMGGAFGVQA